MNPEPATAPLAAPAKRRRRWWRGILILLALVILVPAGYFGYRRYTMDISWEAAEAEADRTDPDWRMTQLLLKRRTVPDKENSALHIITVAGKIKNFTGIADADTPRLFEDLPANARLNAQQEKAVRIELGKLGGVLDEMRQTKDFTYGRFPIKMSPIFFATPIPNHQNARDFGYFLKHDAFLCAEDGAIDEAVESCRACLCAARSMGDEPFIISCLIRIAVQTEAIAGLERALGQGEASEPALKEMQALLELEIKESDWLPALRGERAGDHMLMEDIRTAKLPNGSITAIFGQMANPPAPLKSFNVGDWLVDTFPSTLLPEYPEHLQHMTRLVEAARLPIPEQRPKVREWSEATKASKNRVLRALAPAVEKVFLSHCRSQARLRSAMTAVACERYRLVHKDWPDSLGVLVEQKLLAAVPIDPVDGQPLRYRKEKGIVTIYSIGNDEKDDGGHIDRKTPDAPGSDIGFQLWPMNKRGVAPK